jgi:hypothetical protein
MHLRALGLVLLSLAAMSCSSSESSSDPAPAAPSAAADAGPQTSFAAPAHKAGESWKTSSASVPAPGEAASPPLESTFYVDSAGDRGAYVGRLVGADGGTLQLTYNADGLLVAAGDCILAPGVNTVTFPIEVGRKWNVDYWTACSKTNRTGTGEVVGRETIPTAAFGPVDAFKIVVTVTAVTIGAGPSGLQSTSLSTTTIYWAPRFGISVKEIWESPASTPDGTTSVSITELVSFTPAK